MYLDQGFYLKNKNGELVEVVYFRENWGLHEFINTFKTVGNCENVILTREDLDKVVIFLRTHPCSDIFTTEEDGDIQLSPKFLGKLGALSYYENLIYCSDW